MLALRACCFRSIAQHFCVLRGNDYANQAVLIVEPKAPLRAVGLQLEAVQFALGAPDHHLSRPTYSMLTSAEARCRGTSTPNCAFASRQPCCPGAGWQPAARYRQASTCRCTKKSS